MALAAAALCAPLPAFFAGRTSPDPVSFEFRLHLFFGMLAYSLFVVATFHALLISSVERRLHAAHATAQSGAWFEGRCAMCAIALLGTPRVSSDRRGVCRADSHFCRRHCLFGVLCRPRHALRPQDAVRGPVLADFALLLAGRWLYGWRGRTALRWTLTGFIMLMLAYPGSRFVLEVILHRS